MTKLMILSGALMMTACSTTATTSAEAPQECNAAKAQYAVGQAYTVELGATLQDATGSRSLRAIGPGQAVTMDYRLDRLNIEMDAAEKITRIACG